DGQLTKPWETNAMMDRVRDVLRLGAGAAAGPRPAAAAAPAHRSAASLPTAAIDDDEYGEISIDTGRDSIPTIPRAATVAPAPAPSSGGRISSPSMPAVPAAAHAAPPAAPAPQPPASGGSSP